MIVFMICVSIHPLMDLTCFYTLPYAAMNIHVQVFEFLIFDSLGNVPSSGIALPSGNSVELFEELPDSSMVTPSHVTFW